MASKYHDEDDSQFYDYDDKLDYYDTSYTNNRIENNNQPEPNNNPSSYHRQYQQQNPNLRRFRDVIKPFVGDQLQQQQQQQQGIVEEVEEGFDNHRQYQHRFQNQNLPSSLALLPKPSPLRLSFDRSDYQQQQQQQQPFSSYISSLSKPLKSPLLSSPSSSAQQIEKLSNGNNLLRQKASSSNSKNIFNYFITSRKLRNIYEKPSISNNKNNNNRKISNNHNENDENAIRYKTSTSINGFKNLTSTNFSKQDQKDIKRNSIENNYNHYQQQNNNQLTYSEQHQYNTRNHQQTRSVIDGRESIGTLNYQQSTHDVINAQQQNSIRNSDGITYDRIDISWVETAVPFNIIVGAVLLGLLVLGFLFTFWLKKLQIKRRNKITATTVTKVRNTTDKSLEGNNRNFLSKLANFWSFKTIKSNNSVVNENSIIDRLKVMEHDYMENKNQEKGLGFERKCECRNDNTSLDDDFNDKMQLSPALAEKNRRIYVDEKLSPIIIDDKNFIYTTTVADRLSTVASVDKISSVSASSSSSSSSILNSNRIPVPIPVPVPVPIPIPVPIPTSQQIFPQFINNSGKKDSTFDFNQRFYKNEKSCVVDVKNSKVQQPVLTKSLSLTSSSSSSPSSNPAVLTATRRFSLYERRTQQLHHQLLSKSHNYEIGNLSITVPSSSSIPSAEIPLMQKHSTSISIPIAETYCVSSTTSAKSHVKCNSPKPSTDDKENEVPAGDEPIYSPKMKLSEHILAQQNSPRHFETSPSSASSITTTISRFSFSSKQNLHSETPTSSPSIISTPLSTTIANNNNPVNSSPLLTSAVYKHGDYFRFPEVDCLTPIEKKNNYSSAATTTTVTSPPVAVKSLSDSTSMASAKTTPIVTDRNDSNNQQRRNKPAIVTTNTIQPPINQATRRSRLKSISLDSDGARLVEDNLGIAVEELIEIANQSPKIIDECFVFDDATSNVQNFSLDSENTCNFTTERVIDDKSRMNTKTASVAVAVNENCHHNYNPMNKNRLTISIPNNESQANENECQQCNNDGDDDDTNLSNNSNVVTPKTPTLTQIKQKAISLDSSDTLIMHYMPVSHNLSENVGQGRRQHLSNSATTSLLQISSISVPTTPKRQQLQKQQLQMLCSGTGRNKLIGNKKIGGVGGKYIGTNSTTPPTTAIIKPPSVALSVPGKLHSSSSSSSTSSTATAGTESSANLQLSSSFDYHSCGSIQKQNSTTTINQQHFMRKLRSFNENTIDDDDYNDHYFLDVVDGVVVVEEDSNSSIYDDDLANIHQFNNSNTNLLGANLLNQRCSTSLSLSNNNLKTLPEVMTLNDFTNDNEENYTHHQLYVDDDSKLKTPSSSTPAIVGQFSSSLTQITTQSPTSSGIANSSSIGGGGSIRTPRNSILQRRGSNHSLTLNLNGGSLGNLTKSLSVSNYSLGSTNFQNSQLNLSGSSYTLNNNQQLYNQSAVLNTIAGTTSLSGNCMPDKHPSVSSIINFTGSGTGSSGTTNKKNLLQRRGSNTSLTLNIKGSSCMNLNRFNSHSSLNISSQQHQSYPHYPQPGTHNQTIQGGSSCNQGRKGLLERRNSNASLTLNIQNRALSISNCNLRGSACSLNSNPAEYFEHQLMAESNIDPEHQHCDHEQQYGVQYATSTDQSSHRKFLSSENLNVISQRSKLNQTHVRNLSKTCFGSVSDLNPQQHHQQMLITGQQQNIDGSGYPNMIYNDEHFNFEETINQNAKNVTDSKLPFKQSNLCSCTGVRNITTRPLSPQSTSEDFKMYLANIQLLQNASNMLNNEYLRKLSYIFEKSYSNNKISSLNQSAKDNKKLKEMTNSKFPPSDCSAAVSESTSESKTAIEKTFNNDIINITINFELPNDDEQKSLLRNLHQEFWDLPTNFQEKPLVFGSQAKNRYKSILPNEHSRVILDCEPGYIQEPYINANYIKGPDYTQNSYIATQGPMPNTIYEYWLMIYQNIKKFVSNSTNESKANKLQSAGSGDESGTINIGRRFDFSNVDNKDKEKIFYGKNEKFLYPTNDKQKQENNKNKMNFTQKIVMLTNFIEHNKQKCSIYFPVEESEIILITNQNEKIDNGELIEFYKLYLNKKFNETDDDDEDENCMIKDDMNGAFMSDGYHNKIMNESRSSRRKECDKNQYNNDNDNNTDVHTDTKGDLIDSLQKVIKFEKKQLIENIPKTNYFVIKNDGIVNKNGYTIRKLICLYCQKDNQQQNKQSTTEIYEQYAEQFDCYHYWYPDWPDHRSPNDIGVLLDMSLHLLDGQCEKEFNAYRSSLSSTSIEHQKNKKDGLGEEGAAIRKIVDSMHYNYIDRQPMPIIHCSAGIGRTGCLAAILNGLRQMRLSSSSTVETASTTPITTTKENLESNIKSSNDHNNDKEIHDKTNPKMTKNNLIRKIKSNNNINVDVLAIVCNLRLQRGGMVQNSEQYELIHRTLCLYLKRLEEEECGRYSESVEVEEIETSDEKTLSLSDDDKIIDCKGDNCAEFD